MRTTHSTSPDSGASGQGNTKATARGGIFWRFAARSLKLNKSRTIVSIIGIALSCALITAIFTSVATLYSGLLKAEILTDGTWQVELVNVPDAELVSLRNDPRVVGSFERVSYGDALMPESFQGYWGRYLSVQEWPSKDAVGDLKPLPHLTEGRAPSKPNEIVLTQDLKGVTVDAGNWLYDSLPATGRDDSVPRAAWDGGLEIGSSIELALGERMFLDLESGAEAPCLYTETLYTTETANGDVISEYLANATSPVSYTVVGFYGPATSKSYDQWGSSGPGYLGFVSSPDAPARFASVYVTTNLTNLAEINEFIDDYTGHDTAMQSWGNRSDTPFENWTTGAYTHESLLSYQGITDDRSIWGTLYTLAAILSTVVVVASVSLIYNSFAIAVSERTRQFGLLSSLGASKRQLRRTVYAEALILACIGIPLGLAAGLAGTFVVFNIAGEGIGMLIDQEAFANTGLTTISIHPVVIALCAALALVTVLVSAAVPAWRASRTSAVDAIRASRDVRLTRAERRARTSTRRDHTARPATRNRLPRIKALDALRLRIMGVPGLLAHRNLTRASSKGRVAVASLAVSVALIIISGGISHYLSYLTNVVDPGSSDIEIALNRTLSQDETTADGLAAIDRAYRSFSDVEGATGRGYAIYTSLSGHFEAGMLDIEALSSHGVIYDMPDRGEAADSSAYAPIAALFVDPASWTAILNDNGLDAERYSNPDKPVAVALNGTQSNDGRRYTVNDLFTGTGEATLFTRISPIDDGIFIGVGVDESGEPIALYEDNADSAASFDDEGNSVSELISQPLPDVLEQSYTLPVGAIVKTFPDCIQSYASVWPTLVLPATALPTLAAGSEDIVEHLDTGALATPFAFHSEAGYYGNTMYAYLSVDAQDARAAETQINSIISNDLTGTEWYRTYVANNAEHARSTRLMAETVQLFISCFILITGAIAVANVFNTLTNSIILRRREFAMLKSIGMGNRAFYRMIALECLSYAWRGLLFGLILGAVVTFFTYQAMMMSFEGLHFVVPLGWVLAAVGVVVLVLALSTAYALRKSSAGSIVQTLREDAI